MFKKYNYRILIYCCIIFHIIFLSSFYVSLSQNIHNSVPYISIDNKNEYEINKIVFKGNKHISENELIKVIHSTATNRGLTHKVVDYYTYYFKKDSAIKRFVPRIYFKALSSARKSMSSDVQFFEEYKIEQDLLLLKNYYNMKGFHLAKATYTFLPDQHEKINILTFSIVEDSSSKINSIAYYGLDSLPNEIANKVIQIKTVKKDDNYNEARLMNEVASIQNILLNDGYYYSHFEMPQVWSDSAKYSDSILIRFYPGKRQIISSIKFVEELRGQNPITNDMKMRQLEFNVGDWYSKNKVEHSVSLLYSLGTFESISIDTNSTYQEMTDTTISLVIYCLYKKQQEWGISLLTNYYDVGKVWNAGVDCSYFHRNIGGIGQTFNPYIRFVLKDINSAINNWNQAEFEGQIGINMSQPLLFMWQNSRFGLSFDINYSIKTINNYLRINTFSIPLQFPIKLPNITYFHMANVSFNINWENPMNLTEATNTELSKANDLKDTIEVQEAFALYNILKKYSNKYGTLSPTTNVMGGALIGDKRDNPFAPTKGYYTSLSFDVTNPLFYMVSQLKGAANYLHLSANDLRFWSLNDRTVIALKNKGGMILWFDKDNSYVPMESQLFCGGSNSVRGWSSRSLRYPILSTYGYTGSISDWISDYLGSRVLIEGSVELRYKFSPQIIISNNMIEQQLSYMGLTYFIDWGNAFNWFGASDGMAYSYKWFEYITRLGVASGIGFRYDTPVGPLRIDLAWKIFDPSGESIFVRHNPLSSPNFHIGLGHAF